MGIKSHFTLSFYAPPPTRTFTNSSAKCPIRQFGRDSERSHIDRRLSGIPQPPPPPAAALSSRSESLCVLIGDKFTRRVAAETGENSHRVALA